MGEEVEFEFQTFHSQIFPLLLFLFFFFLFLTFSLFPFLFPLFPFPFSLSAFSFPLLLPYSQCRSSGSRLKSWWNTSSAWVWVCLPPSSPVVVLFFGQLDACVLPKAPITCFILFLRLSASSLFLFNFLWSNLSLMHLLPVSWHSSLLPFLSFLVPQILTSRNTWAQSEGLPL